MRDGLLYIEHQMTRYSVTRGLYLGVLSRNYDIPQCLESRKIRDGLMTDGWKHLLELK